MMSTTDAQTEGSLALRPQEVSTSAPANQNGGDSSTRQGVLEALQRIAPLYTVEHLGKLAPGPLQALIASIDSAQTPTSIKAALRSLRPVEITTQHLDLIESIGDTWGRAVVRKTKGATVASEEGQKIIEQHVLRKLRQLFNDVILFDLQHGTKTSGYIPEEMYTEFANTAPGLFANEGKNVEHGVRHRASLTSILKIAIDQGVTIHGEHKIKPENITVYDSGCGTGKPGIMARLSYDFEEVIGLDYFEAVLELARENIKTLGLSGIRVENADLQIYNDFGKKGSEAGPAEERKGNAILAYNPADETVIEPYARNILASGIPSTFAYIKPLHADCFPLEKNGWHLETEVKSPDEDSQLNIYSCNMP